MIAARSVGAGGSEGDCLPTRHDDSVRRPTGRLGPAPIGQRLGSGSVRQRVTPTTGPVRRAERRRSSSSTPSCAARRRAAPRPKPSSSATETVGRSALTRQRPGWIGARLTAWIGAPGAGSLGGGRRPARRRVGRLHRHAPRQGRPRRAQRRRQDEPVPRARRRGRAGRRPGRPQGRASATSRRTRASPACSTAARPSPTSCPGAASTPSWSASRSCASPWRSAPTSATSPATPGPRSSSARTAGTPPRARRAPSPPGSASARAASTTRSACCPGGERRRVELARILFAGSDVLCLDEPTNHLDVDAKEWLMGFLRGYRGRAARHQPRPRPARRGDHPRAPPRPARRGRHRPPRRVQGHVHAVPSTPGPPTRSAWPRLAARQAKEIARMQRFVDRFGAKATQGGDRPQHGEADRPAGGRQGRGAARRQDAARPLPASRRRPGGTVIEVAGLTKSYGGPPVFDDVAFDLGRGERLLVLGLNGAGKTSLLRILAGETEADRGTLALGPQRHRRLLRPGARQPARRRVAARQHPP